MRPLVALWLIATLALGVVALPLNVPAVVTTLAKALKMPEAGAFIAAWLGWLNDAAGFALLYGLITLPILFLLKRRAMEKGQAAIHAALNQSPVHLLLPRRDAPPVDPAEVKLWGRMIEVLPPNEHVAFELSGGELGLAFSMQATGEASRAAITQLMSEWRGTRAKPVSGQESDPITLPDGHFAWQIELRPAGREQRITAASPDPLIALLTELSRLPDGARGGLQVLARRDLYTQSKLAVKAAQLTGTTAAAGGVKGMTKSGEQRRLEKGLDERGQRQFIEARVLVWATAPDEGQAQSIAASLARTLSAGFTQTNPVRQVAGWKGAPFHREFPIFGGGSWADDELALIAHLVGSDGREAAPQLMTAPARPIPPAAGSRIPKEARTLFKLLEEAQAETADMTGDDEAADCTVIDIPSPAGEAPQRGDSSPRLRQSRLAGAKRPSVVIEEV